jgi:hypothetical protein
MESVVNAEAIKLSHELVDGREPRATNVFLRITWSHGRTFLSLIRLRQFRWAFRVTLFSTSRRLHFIFTTCFLLSFSLGFFLLFLFVLEDIKLFSSLFR